jgi:hypothetical protein
MQWPAHRVGAVPPGTRTWGFRSTTGGVVSLCRQRLLHDVTKRLGGRAALRVAMESSTSVVVMRPARRMRAD